MGPLGAQEMIVICVLALLLFGPKKLPELARMLGKGLSEFRRAKNELKATFETHLSELEKETQATPATASKVAQTDYSSVQYPYAYDEYGQYGDYSSPPETPEVSLQTPAPPQTAAAVPGTVPRSNSVQAIENRNGSPAVAAPSTAAPGEEHSA